MDCSRVYRTYEKSGRGGGKRMCCIRDPLWKGLIRKPGLGLRSPSQQLTMSRSDDPIYYGLATYTRHNQVKYECTYIPRSSNDTIPFKPIQRLCWDEILGNESSIPRQRTGTHLKATDLRRLTIK